MSQRWDSNYRTNVIQQHQTRVTTAVPPGGPVVRLYPARAGPYSLRAQNYHESVSWTSWLNSSCWPWFHRPGESPTYHTSFTRSYTPVACAMQVALCHITRQRRVSTEFPVSHSWRLIITGSQSTQNPRGTQKPMYIPVFPHHIRSWLLRTPVNSSWKCLVRRKCMIQFSIWPVAGVIIFFLFI